MRKLALSRDSKRLGPQRFTPVVFQQEKPSETARDAEDTARANALINQVDASSDSAPLAWNKAFAGKRFGSSTLATVCEILHGREQHDMVVECLLAAIRNDHAQPWMYDVLALEMQLAKRPQNEQDRVLLSRIDFADGDEPQMLLTASMLSRFGAYEQAIRVCREATKRNPWQSTTWGIARRIADRSNDPQAIAWAQCGTLIYVWDANHVAEQAAAKTVLTTLIEELRSRKRTELAEQIQRQLQTALIRDMMITITWAGSADLDLSVIEPGGQTCSYRSPRTSNGGLLYQQGFGGSGSGTGNTDRQTERYVCVNAPAGDYRVRVRNAAGRLILGKVQLRVTRHAGTDREKTETRLYEVGDKGVEIRVPLNNGRATKRDYSESR